MKNIAFLVVVILINMNLAFGQTVLTVTNTNDSGAGSLREAISQANNSTDNVQIVFDIADPAPWVIEILNELPAISPTNLITIEIDGSTQPGFVMNDINTYITLQATSNVIGLRIMDGSSNGSSIYGLAIKGFSTGIQLMDAHDITIGDQNRPNVIIENQGFGIRAEISNNLTVAHNKVGTDFNGNTGLGNEDVGVFLLNSNQAVINDNTICDNAEDGIYVEGSVDLTVQGNRIGVTDGNSPLGNRSGITFHTDSHNALVGGVNPDQRNIISASNGQTTSGVSIFFSDNVTFLNNYIGVGASGNEDYGNFAGGIYIYFSQGTEIGNGIASGRNIIAANGDFQIYDMESSGGKYMGNYIGVGADETTTFPASSGGVIIEGSSNIEITDNIIKGNSEDAVFASFDASNIIIGDEGKGNIISENAGYGIRLSGANTVSNYFLENLIFNNQSGGIFLENSANLSGGGVSEPPVLTGASICDGILQVSGEIETTNTNYDYRVEFFLIPEGEEDPSGAGQGNIYLGYEIVEVFFSPEPFVFNYTGPTAYNEGDVISATATIIDNGQLSMTSEFAQNVTIVSGIDEVTISERRPISCAGDNDGTLEANVTGGSGDYSYQWFYLGDGIGMDSDSLSGVFEGTYQLTVTDNQSGCQVFTGYTISEPDPISVSANVIQQISCYSDCDAQGEAVVTGGTEPYTYEWDDGLNQTTQIATDLCANFFYNLAVADANGCTASDTMAVYEPAPIDMVLNPFVQDVSCFGEADGSIEGLEATGGEPPYEYSLDQMTWQPGGDFLDLFAGTYDVYVRDANGCEVYWETYVINEPTELSIVLNSLTDVSCFGDFDGAIDVFANGGSPDYLYSLDGDLPQGTGEFTGLTAGTYLIEVTDDLGCTVSDSYVIDEPDELIVDATITDVSCNGDSDGVIEASAFGGTPGYMYNLNEDPSQGSGLFENLTPGDYTVTVMDANNCEESITVTVNEPAPEDASFFYDDTQYCLTSPNPLPTITGEPGGTFSISDFGLDVDENTGELLFDQAAEPFNFYTITYTTPCGQTATFEVEILSEDAWFDYDLFGPVCQGSGVIFPYMQPMDPGVYSSTPAGLELDVLSGDIDVDMSSPGSYQVFYTTDNCGEMYSQTIEIAPIPSFTVDFIEPSCTGACDGEGTVVLTEGTEPFTAEWLPIEATGAYQDNLCADIYSITVIDDNGCEFTDSFELQDGEPDDASFFYDDNVYCIGVPNPTPTITGSPGGNFTVTPTGINVDNTTGEIDLDWMSEPMGGIYTISYTTPCGQTENFEVEIIEEDPYFGYFSGALCQGSGTEIPYEGPYTTGTFTSDPAGVIFVDNTTGEIDLNATPTGNYMITFTTDNCGATHVEEIVVYEQPTATIYGGGAYCDGEQAPSIFIDLTGTDPWDFDFYLDGALLGSYSQVEVSTVEVGLPDPGEYHVDDLVDANGCTWAWDGSSVIVEEIPLPDTPDVTPLTQNVCYAEESDALEVIDAQNDINWYDDPDLTNLVFTGDIFEPGQLFGDATYYVVAVNTEGCESTPIEVTINVILPDSPQVSGTNFTYCQDEQADEITATWGAGAMFWIERTDSTLVGTGGSYTPPTNEPGEFEYAAIVAENGCFSMPVPIDVTVIGTELTLTPNSLTGCEGEEFVVEAATSGTVEWFPTTGIDDPNASVVTVTLVEDMSYTVTSSESGCESTAELLVTIDEASCEEDEDIEVEEGEIITYNVFTPDDDGVNDTWIIDGIDYFDSNRVIIYNRWGDAIREFANYNNMDVVWDGKNGNGVLVTNGTYFYVIELEGESEKHSGWVQVIR